MCVCVPDAPQIRIQCAYRGMAQRVADRERNETQYAHKVAAEVAVRAAAAAQGPEPDAEEPRQPAQRAVERAVVEKDPEAKARPRPSGPTDEEQH